MKLFRLILIAAMSVVPAFGQSVPTVISQCLSVLNTTGVLSQDVQLTGDIEYIAGSQDEKGTVLLISNQAGMTRTEIRLPSENVLEAKRTGTAGRGGESQKGTTAVVSIGVANLLVDPAWFFPEHFLEHQLDNARSVSLVPNGPSSTPGVIHLKSWVSMGASTSPHAAIVRRLSGIDLYIDSTSSLLNEVDYDTHPEANDLVSISVRVLFSDYKLVQGHLVPFHIQKYLNGTLNADIHINKVVVNPGISLSNYKIQ